MRRYREFIREDLNDATIPDISQSSAAQQAAEMGLNHVGFGRYEDPRTNQVTHISQNDKLVPFARAVKTNSYQELNANDFGGLAENQAQQLQIDSDQLTRYYSPDKFSDTELDAIKYYTDVGHIDITNKLLSLPPGLPGDAIQPTTPDDVTPRMIQALDKALFRNPCPINTFVYAIVNPDERATLMPGMALSFKDYLATSLDIGYTIGNLPPGPGSYSILQILIPTGSAGAYVEDYSSEPGSYMFVLPRETVLDIASGPKKLRGTAQVPATEGLPDPTITVYFFNCQVR